MARLEEGIAQTTQALADGSAQQVISGTLAIYLIQQWRYTRADLAPYKGQEVQLQQAARVVADFNKSIPARQDFLKRLAEYARQDPKVLPILFKYGLAQARPATNASPAQPTP